MGNKRNRSSRPGQSASSERQIRASEGNEAIIKTLSDFQNVSFVRSRKVLSNEWTQNENEIQVWTQRMTEGTKHKMSELRKEMKFKLEIM